MKSFSTLPYLLTCLLVFSSCASYKGKGEFKVQEKIFYAETKLEEQMAEAYIPNGDGPFPGVILVHGGGWSARDLSDMRSIGESLASHGFSVLNINYRLSPEFHHPVALQDLEKAHLYFKENASKFKLNINKIALWGYSSGGHQVSFYALTHNKIEKTKVQAVVTGGAPYDLTWYPQSPYVKLYLGDFRDNMLESYVEASPVNYISENEPPFFIYHALNDTLVEYPQATSFEAKLKLHKNKVERYDVTFWGHGATFYMDSGAVKAAILFLKKEFQVK